MDPLDFAAVIGVVGSLGGVALGYCSQWILARRAEAHEREKDERAFLRRLQELRIERVRGEFANMMRIRGQMGETLGELLTLLERSATETDIDKAVELVGLRKQLRQEISGPFLALRLEPLSSLMLGALQDVIQYEHETEQLAFKAVEAFATEDHLEDIQALRDHLAHRGTALRETFAAMREELVRLEEEVKEEPRRASPRAFSRPTTNATPAEPPLASDRPGDGTSASS